MSVKLVERAQQVLRALQKKKEELQRQVSETMQIIEKLKNDYERYLKYIDEHRADIAGAERLLAEIEKLKSEVDGLEARLRQLQSTKTDIERKLQETQRVKVSVEEKRKQLEEIILKYAGAMAGSTPFGPKPETKPQPI